MITVPVSSSMYQTMVANISHLHQNGDGTMCITPMQVPNTNPVISTTNPLTHNRLVRAIISGSRHTHFNNNNNYNNNNNHKYNGYSHIQHSNHPPPQSHITENLNNISDKIVHHRVIQKIDTADSEHTHASFDAGGNVIIHLSAARDLRERRNDSIETSEIKSELESEDMVLS